MRSTQSSKSQGPRIWDSERGFGAMAIVFLAGVALFLAFGLPPVPTGPAFLGAGSEEPTQGGSFVFHHESDVSGFDPHRTWNELSNIGIKLLFEGLIEYDAEDLHVVPRLARALPEVSDDALTWTFHLHEGVRFHNGRELTADDVRWSMEHMLHPDTGSPGIVFYNSIQGYDEFRSGEAEHVSGIQVLDRYRIRFQLREPDQTFLNSMGLTFAYPVAREMYGEGSDPSREPIGTGAFVLESWEPGVRVVFARNPDFFREGEPHVDRMVFELNLQRGPAFMRFQAGTLDAVHRMTPTDYLWFRRQPAWEPYWEETPNIDIWGVIMNCELAPFTDVHIRRAVAFAINRDQWNRARANRLFLTGQPIPSQLLGYTEGLPGAHRYDLDEAREEMRLAGHPVTCTGTGGEERCSAAGMSQEIEFWVGEGETGRMYGELVQADLGRIGLSVRIRQVAFPMYLSQTGRPGTVQMLLGGWSADYPDPASFVNVLFHSRSIHESDSENRSYYRNPVVDDLLDRARREPDTEARRALYVEVSRILVDDAPWAFVFQNLKLEAWQPHVRGYHPNPVFSEMYRDLWLDLPTRRAALGGALPSGLAALRPSSGIQLWGQP